MQKEMEAHFHIRTSKHIGSVIDNAMKLVKAMPELSDLLCQVEDHDQSKFKEPEYTNYIHITWMHKMKKEGKTYIIPDHIDDHEATFHHVKNNMHHPEYWDDNSTNAAINKEDRHKPSGVITDGTLMNYVSLAEMTCDWSAVAQELGTSVYEWAENNINVRWEFTETQEEFIYDCLDVIWEE